MRLNGWQRLWLVRHGVPWLVACRLVAAPIGWKIHDYYFSFRWELEKDFQTPRCRAYRTAPRHAHPASFRRTCYHIAFRRRFDNATVPYTLEDFDRHGSVQWRESYLQALGLGVVATGLLSAFVYLCGLDSWLDFSGFCGHDG